MLYRALPVGVTRITTIFLSDIDIQAHYDNNTTSPSLVIGPDPEDSDDDALPNALSCHDVQAT